MFDNQLVLLPAFTGSVGALSLSSAETRDGKTIHRLNQGSGNFTEFTISHQESTENKGIISDRYLVRIDFIKPDVNGAPVKASVYMNVIYPRVIYTHAMMEQLANMLFRFILEDSNLPSTPISILTRIFNGET